MPRHVPETLFPPPRNEQRIVGTIWFSAVREHGYKVRKPDPSHHISEIGGSRSSLAASEHDARLFFNVVPARGQKWSSGTPPCGSEPPDRCLTQMYQ